ncbi:glycosyltransferase [Acinetobacter indicus]|uniref:glycosyltransferase n=1 Tax=Acinetobacter indicus TaxID=756892 RepID=UPI00209AC119|nr:glycosyltransferase [Acinetobacter indicus]MCO8088303.1 glycosyltransferase [Acinetobacter indicus]
MKVLYLITGLGVGGAEKVVCDLADQMILKGHDVKIVYLTGSVLVKPNSPRVELLPLHLNSASNVFSASRKYKKIIRDFSPDVIHSHMIHANIFARLNHLSFKYIRLICTAHNSNEGGKLRMMAYRLTNFLSDFNSNVSKEATESLISKGAFNHKNLATVYNGIDLKKFIFFNKDIDLKKLKILSVGRFSEQKDYPNLLHAIAIFRQNLQHKEYVLKIAGDGELRPQIEELIEHLGLKNNVTLLGRREDIPQLMQEADFFILPSAYEGFGLVVAEAMACGAFVIATNSGGVAEVMGDTGILVPPQNSEALAEAIKQAVSKTPLEIKANNLKARQRVEELFSLEKSVENWLKIYRNE